MTLSSSKTITEELDSSANLVSSLPSGKTPEYKALSHAESNAKIIEIIEEFPVDPEDITKADVLNFYESIQRNYLITPAVVRHPKFNLLREATETHLQHFNTKELEGILITILPSKVLMHDKLSHMIINALVKRANNLPFNKVVFIDFILHKYYNVSELNKDCSILRLTLQRLFLSGIEDELNDLNDFNYLMQIVGFCNNNIEVITPKIANLITTSLLLIDDDEFKLSDIISCFSVLASFGKLNEHIRKLLNKMVDLWCQSEVKASEVKILPSILKSNIDTIDKERFNESKFIRHCVNIVTSEPNRKLLFSVQNEFNRLVSVECIRVNSI